MRQRSGQDAREAASDRSRSVRGGRLRAVQLLALIVAVGCGGAGDASRGSAANAGERFRPLTVGEMAPQYTARTLDGDTVTVGASMSDDAGTVTLLNIWATWCGPCKREFPELERLHRLHAPKGLHVVAVSIDRGDDSTVAAFARELGATFTIARDPAGTVQERFQTIGVPESYLIAADGTLLWRHVGELHPDDRTLADALASAGL